MKTIFVLFCIGCLLSVAKYRMQHETELPAKIQMRIPQKIETLLQFNSSELPDCGNATFPGRYDFKRCRLTPAQAFGDQ